MTTHKLHTPVCKACALGQRRTVDVIMAGQSAPPKMCQCQCSIPFALLLPGTYCLCVLLLHLYTRILYDDTAAAIAVVTVTAQVLSGYSSTPGTWYVLALKY